MGAGTPAPGAWEDAPRSFAEALAAAGWQVEVLVDGSLVLTPAGAAAQDISAGSPEPAGAAVGAGWRALEGFGWRVETDAEGATLLYPPGASPAPAVMPPPAPVDAEPAPTSQGVVEQATTAPGPDARAGLARELDVLLTERGWRAERAPDGSLLLLPLQPASASVEPATGFVPAVVAGGRVELPLSSAAEVRRVAVSWLAAVGATQLFPGRVYIVGQVYLVDVLDSAPPHERRHQIAIHAADGRVVVLH
jgi:hypothetical protein